MAPSWCNLGSTFPQVNVLLFVVVLAIASMPHPVVAHYNRSFIPAGSSLTVMIEVEFSTLDQEFVSCCKNYTYNARTFKISPYSSTEIVKTGETQSEYTPTVTLQKTPPATNDFTGTQFTLLMVDPDVSSATAGTADRPLLHWMVMNIHDGVTKNGFEVQSYRGPRPPDGVHYYYYLLYEQAGNLDTQTDGDYGGDSCSAGIAGRCNFKMSEFVTNNQLTLVGVSWMRAQTDEFVRYSYVSSGRNETEVCAGTAGYANPCPVSSATRIPPCTAMAVLLATIAHRLY